MSSKIPPPSRCGQTLLQPPAGCLSVPGLPFLTAFCHACMKPAHDGWRRREVQLTGEAMEAIGDYYAELRAAGDGNALPVTVRSLETIIRLSSAAAKCRLSGEVEVADVEVARRMLSQTMDLERPVGDEAQAEAAARCVCFYAAL